MGAVAKKVSARQKGTKDVENMTFKEVMEGLKSFLVTGKIGMAYVENNSGATVLSCQGVATEDAPLGLAINLDCLRLDKRKSPVTFRLVLEKENIIKWDKELLIFTAQSVYDSNSEPWRITLSTRTVDWSAL